MSKDKTVPFEQAKQVYDLSFRVSRTTISVIDAMTQRGAVKGEELSAIGQLRDQCVQVAQLCEAFQSEHDE
jgi:predicted methyltransferase